MDPLLTTLLTAIVSGATAAVAQAATAPAIQDAYDQLKELMIRKLGGKADIATAIQQVEGKPASQSRQGLLKEELETALAATPTAAQDQELLTKAQALLKLLEAQGQPTAPTVQLTQTGSGGIAYGAGAKAAGERGIVAGTIHGPVSTGDHARQIQTGSYIERQTNTGGGPYIEGNVNTTGDFVGRDKKVSGDEVRGNQGQPGYATAANQDDPFAQSPALQSLRAILSTLYEMEADARRMAQDAGLDIRQINFNAKPLTFWQHVLVEAHKRAKVKALVASAGFEYPAKAEALRQAYQAYANSARDLSGF